MTLSIGIDVGGTKIAAGVVDESGNVLARLRRPTPASDADALVATIISMAQELAAQHTVESIGVGAAGFVDGARRSIIFAPNIMWRDEPLADKVESATGVRTVVENDANAAAWGEFTYGVARNAESIVFITLGTGVGGGIIINGKLLRGSNGFAGEIGHMNLVPDGVNCRCGARGCWEQYSSGTAMVRMAREASIKSPELAKTLLRIAGNDPRQITGHTVMEAAKLGCTAAIRAFNQAGHYVGIALADLVSVLDPDLFVLAGGVSEAGSLIRVPAEQSFRDQQMGSSYRPSIPIVTAALGNNAGMVGAADLSRRTDA